ncbi:DNA-directed RNA polymerase subunit delta [Azotosporobacter soli]|uniref:DNA-directed RNA polymerase subunit delta n=1 Tax=Azotosporobacter soli TaxID=3055040 RepID=UPI0031FE9F25
MKAVSEVEVAYQVLRSRGYAMYFRDLIGSVLTQTGQRASSQAHAMAEVHTQINMDSRFIHMGKGMWGLAEWTPQQMNARMAEDGEWGGSGTSTPRREKLFEEIQQEYVAAAAETGEQE